ncbi:hypothetical protein [Streptomyces sp. NPDC059533]|uniref:hypothetical protein n=1 Tax=unclassified Streptomyces TaxID=2593676 RepID=UPI00367C9AD4
MLDHRRARPAPARPAHDHRTYRLFAYWYALVLAAAVISADDLAPIAAPGPVASPAR